MKKLYFLLLLYTAILFCTCSSEKEKLETRRSRVLHNTIEVCMPCGTMYYFSTLGGRSMSPIILPNCKPKLCTIGEDHRNVKQ